MPTRFVIISFDERLKAVYYAIVMDGKNYTGKTENKIL
jgi:hypothetical protein